MQAINKKLSGPQPKNATLRIQARHDQRFHVKHLYANWQRRNLVRRMLAFHGHPDALLCQTLA
jgi:hypothetical protein